MSCLDFSIGLLLVSSLWLNQHCSSQNHASFCLTAPYQVPGVNCLAKWFRFHLSTNLDIVLYSKLTLSPSTPHTYPEIATVSIYSPITWFQVTFSSFLAQPPLHIHLLKKKTLLSFFHFLIISKSSVYNMSINPLPGVYKAKEFASPSSQPSADNPLPTQQPEWSLKT